MSGLAVQVCGAAHLSNSGIFDSAGRRLVFDVNDFDETPPGPWEWDVERLATGPEVAGRDNRFAGKNGSPPNPTCKTPGSVALGR